LHINNLKDHEVVKEMFHAPMNIKTTVTFSILFVAALIALLFASGQILENQQVFAANTGNVGHLYEGGDFARFVLSSVVTPLLFRVLRNSSFVCAQSSTLIGESISLF
jgi:hypothetical protein